MGSQAIITPGNLELTPMRVKFNGVDLGATLEGVTVAVNYKTSDLMADQFGTTRIDSRVSGKEFSVKMILAEVGKKENWKIAFPHAKMITSGGNKMMYFDMAIGDSMLARAQVLLIHPLSKDDADLAGDFSFYKAVCKSASEVKYGPEDQVGLEVEFSIFPDTSVSPARFFVHGDPSLGLVAASAAAAVAGGGNTGNGTVGSISVGASAVTETITMTAVHAATNGGVFHVSGSVSGSLGLATVGSGFTSSKINFTIADGSTDFALNDSFTIAVTGPNYA